MYGISTYIWFIFMVNVGKYSIHGSYGLNNNINICPSQISHMNFWTTDFMSQQFGAFVKVSLRWISNMFSFTALPRSTSSPVLWCRPKIVPGSRDICTHPLIVTVWPTCPILSNLAHAKITRIFSCQDLMGYFMLSLYILHRVSLMKLFAVPVRHLHNLLLSPKPP